MVPAITSKYDSGSNQPMEAMGWTITDEHDNLIKREYDDTVTPSGNLSGTSDMSSLLYDTHSDASPNINNRLVSLTTETTNRGGTKDTVFACDFETWTGTLPTGDPDSFDNNNGWLDSLYGSAHSESKWAYSWTAGDTLGVDIQLLDSQSELTFWKAAEEASHPMDLEVYVNGNLVFSDLGYTHTDYEQETVDLSAYNGMNITLEIVGNTSDFYGQMIDDITVTSESETNISLNISLYPGWNLITIPVENNWYASDIADNVSECISVSRWDSQNQTYKTYIVGGPAAFDFPINPGHGYFVDMNQADDLLVDGLPIDNVSISLKVGWNLLGWYDENNITASGLSEDINGSVSLSKWNATAQTYKTYIVGGPAAFDFTVSRGIGLFVDVKQNSTWSG